MQLIPCDCDETLLNTDDVEPRRTVEVMLGNLIQSKTSTYGALGTAATILLAFFLIGRVIVGAAVLNATLYERRIRSRERLA